MNRLYKYMDKLGIFYTTTAFGSSYFYNAPEIHFPAAHIHLERGDINSAAWKNFTRYCKRWGYDVFDYRGYPGFTVVSVCRTDDRAALGAYLDYQKKAIAACEQAMHIRYSGQGFTGMSDGEFNDYLRGIMNYYGDEYRNSRAA